ncbi:response regulator [Pedobacter sp. HMWF019]|uniref:response regulator transcription factor n=1 Tax=Pedobacter sp. HMWF019 TaxID=2056856 RepID=UPI000D348CCB|nr:response regulator [Pedobacter sp. HMWF019]PTS92379.1 response regulator [Pedobacter sp. HMWF019]
MKKILVLDDNPDILEIITILLELEGYEIRTMENGHEIHYQIKNFQPDLLIIDVMLGDLDGRDLCNVLKQNFATSSMPIIMISASHDLNLKNKKRACKPDDFLAKPFDIQSLIDKVAFQLAS